MALDSLESDRRFLSLLFNGIEEYGHKIHIKCNSVNPIPKYSLILLIKIIVGSQHLHSKPKGTGYMGDGRSLLYIIHLAHS